MNDKIGMVGVFETILRDKDGRVKAHETVRNGITTIGFDQACALLGDAAVKIAYLGVGWGVGADGAFAVGQTDLLGASKNRKGATYTHTPGTKTFTITASWGVNDPVAGTADIGEIGTFWGASGANMFSRLPRSSRLNKLATDTLEIRWTLTLA